MEKQQKTLTKIKHSIDCGNTTPLGTKPNDECYTSMQDILNELSYWANLGKFENKKIICPCDWDIVEGQDIYSIEIIYKDPGVAVIGNNVYTNVASVKYDLWSEEDNVPVIKEIVLAENEIEDFLRNKLTCNFLRTFTQKARTWKIKSVTASGYNPAIGKGVKFQDVDYSKYDVCVTNPPFSLYGEFMKTIVDKIDFIVLAPFLNRVTPNVGLYLMLKKAYLGTGRQFGCHFNNVTKEGGYKDKLVLCDWITSFDEYQKEVNAQHFNPQIDYETYKDEYVTMENMVMKDGNLPIRVPGTQWPDYDGWMFSSVTVLDKLDQDAYEWYGTNFSGYYNKVNPTASPFACKASARLCMIPGKQMFHGIVFRKKKRGV